MQDKKKAELIEAFQTRASIYSLLYTIYVRELSQTQIEALANMDLDSLKGLDPLIAEGAHIVKRFLRRVRSETREELAVDYAHMFYAAGSAKHESRAVPYESVFTSAEGLLMQEARDQVLRYMLNEHVEPNPSLHVPEDHIAFMFDFMARLCMRCSEALNENDLTEAQRLINVQQSFHSEHIANWIDQLCDAIERCGRTTFYKGFSMITRGFAHIDSELIDELTQAMPQAA
ncbi:molecular chaperone [Denitrobacterium detoxificans]|uniref:TorD/DmsD family molecular chaperone n=1 Tax=Denitrobacterium detoxificans TaxID=79604 RepID=UPI0026ED103C|nr:molecular chaperone TorD family protein [Denitrobacterium detoxificans]MBE6466485.1 hypothetical protein [Denitrobacterium detoxificans]